MVIAKQKKKTKTKDETYNLLPRIKKIKGQRSTLEDKVNVLVKNCTFWSANINISQVQREFYADF